MSWVTSYGWQCDTCGTDSGITFGYPETAEREAAKHAESAPEQAHKITIIALHDWDPNDEDYDDEDTSDLAYEGGGYA